MKGVITYEWWRENADTESGKGEVLDHHREALAETALIVIGGQATQGCREGMLTDNISMAGDDSEEGVSYKGYWKSSFLREGDNEY